MIKLKKVGILPVCLPETPYYCSTTFPIDKPVPKSLLGTYLTGDSTTYKYYYSGSALTVTNETTQDMVANDSNGYNFYYLGEFTGDVGLTESGVKAIKFLAAKRNDIPITQNAITGVILTSYIRNYYWDGTKGYIIPESQFNQTNNGTPYINTGDFDNCKTDAVEVNKTAIDLTKVPTEQLSWYRLFFTNRAYSSNNSWQTTSYDPTVNQLNRNKRYSDTFVKTQCPASYCFQQDVLYSQIPNSVFSWQIEENEQYSLMESGATQGYLSTLGIPVVKPIGYYDTGNWKDKINNGIGTIELIAKKLKQVNASKDFGYILEQFIDRDSKKYSEVNSANTSSDDNNIICSLGDIFILKSIKSGDVYKALKFTGTIDSDPLTASDSSNDPDFKPQLYMIQKIFNNNIIAFCKYSEDNNENNGEIIGLTKKNNIILQTIDPPNNNRIKEVINYDSFIDINNYKQLFYNLLTTSWTTLTNNMYDDSIDSDNLNRVKPDYYFKFPSTVVSNAEEAYKWQKTCAIFWNTFYSLLFFLGYNISSDTLIYNKIEDSLANGYNFVEIYKNESEEDLADNILNILSKQQHFILNGKQYSFHQNFYELKINDSKIEFCYLDPKVVDATVVSSSIASDGTKSTSSTSPSSSTTLQVAVLGDSIVKGMNDSGIVKKYDLYGQVNLRAEQINQIYSNIDGKNYDRIIVILGVNNSGESLDQFYEHYVNMIKKLKGHMNTEAPNAQLILHSIFPVNNTQASNNGYTVTMEKINDLNDKISYIVEEYGVQYNLQFINATDAEKNNQSIFLNSDNQLKSDFSADGLHLNKAAAEAWYNWIQTQSF